MSWIITDSNTAQMKHSGTTDKVYKRSSKEMGFSFMLEAEVLLSFPPRAAEHLRSSASGIIHSLLFTLLFAIITYKHDTVCADVF